jgi:hypothetical protein
VTGFPKKVDQRIVAVIKSLEKQVKQLGILANDPTEIDGVLNRTSLTSQPLEGYTPGAPGFVLNNDTQLITTTGVDGSTVSIIPGASEYIALSPSLSGVYEAIVALSTPDPLQIEPAYIGSVILNQESYQLATFWHSPIVSSGIVIGLVSENDEGDDGPYMIIGTITTAGTEDIIVPMVCITVNAFIMYDGSGSINVATLTGSGNWDVPETVSTLKCECWGGGGGAGAGGVDGQGGTGGGGAEYACEPNLAVPSGGTCAYSVGSGGAGTTESGTGHAGAATTFAGTSVTVEAHPGLAGNSTGGDGGDGGDGSSNTIHYSGGNGGDGAGPPNGSGGGSSAGTSSPGNTPSGYAGATAVSGGGYGGDGAIESGSSAVEGGFPGGGGGGGASYAFGTGAGGGAGSIRLTYVTSIPPIAFLMAWSSGNDPFGNSFSAGFSQPNQYSLVGTSTTQLINSTSFTTIAGLSITGTLPVGAYRVRAIVILIGVAASAGNPLFQFNGSAVANPMRVRMLAYPDSGSSIAVNGGLATGLGVTVTGQVLSTTNQQVIDLEGIMQVTTAGSIELQAACSSASDTYDIYGTTSFLEIDPF